MKRYLLDTNICIYYIKGLYELDQKLKAVGADNCYISEITLAELKYGVENSDRPEKNQKTLEDFLEGLTILPIYSCIDLYAKEKARLRKKGVPVDDFDLLIGCTAIAHDMIMVTRNTTHFKRIQGISLEDWTQ